MDYLRHDSFGPLERRGVMKDILIRELGVVHQEYQIRTRDLEFVLEKN
jgi:hypothetical protein